MTHTTRIIVGDAIAGLRRLEDASIDSVVTSPPYWRLRDYGVEGQIGLEDTPTDYIEAVVAVFREVRRVLRDDGAAWVNMGDCYVGSGRSGGEPDRPGTLAFRSKGIERPSNRPASRNLGGRSDALPIRPSYRRDRKPMGDEPHRSAPGLKEKDLVGMPWRLAFALQDDGWYLRSDVIWHKPNPMPESVADRPTKAHEYVFLLSKSERYRFYGDAILEPFSDERRGRDGSTRTRERNRGGRTDGFTKPNGIDPSDREGRNSRSVWTIATQPFRSVRFEDAHFATFPEELARRCVVSTCPRDGTVLDPFFGSGTVGLAAAKTSRSSVGCELNPKYARLAARRIAEEASILTRVSIERNEE